MEFSFFLYNCAIILLSLVTNGTAYKTRNGGHIVTPNNGNRVNPENQPIIVIPTSTSTTTSTTTTPASSSTTPLSTSTQTTITTSQSTPQETTKNIDLSHQDMGNSFGTTSATIATTSPSMGYRSFNHEKCNEYYDIGTRKTRMSELKVFIIGGTPSKQKEFPHMAALGYGSKTTPKFLCGGSLISENYVITAAHCLSAHEIGEIQYVRLGTTLLQTETLNSKDYDVIKRIPHPDYVTGKYYNDIALLQLDKSVSFNEFIAPICLYSGNSASELVGTTLQTIGWGKTTPNGDVTSELQKADINYVPHQLCQEIYSNISKNVLPDGIREESQVCAGTQDGSKDACQGDSGGPLQLQKDGRMYLVGVTSFGIGCGRPGSAGVYTKVSRYIPWLEQTVWM